jgi:hypothetical protein
LQQFHAMLRWTGEVAVRIPPKSLALVGRLLHMEASTAAWQDYLLFNAFLACLALLPAIGVQYCLWQRRRSQATVEPQSTPRDTPSRASV